MDDARDQERRDTKALLALRNVGKATLVDFRLLGIATIVDLATRNADTLYVQLCEITGQRQDPCVHDVFAAVIHEARTGEAQDWWHRTAERKRLQAEGLFPRAGVDAG